MLNAFNYCFFSKLIKFDKLVELKIGKYTAKDASEVTIHSLN